MWRNAEDADVGRFLKLFTELPLDEIANLAALQGSEINEAKKVLANEATTLLHGAAAAEAAASASKAAFEDGRLSEDLPTIEFPRAQFEAGVALATVAADAGLASSRSEARRLAQGGGLRVNDAAETDGQRLLTMRDLNNDGVVKLAAGRKKIVLVRAV
jgi:tyrosyl-tRNA synthetase